MSVLGESPRAKQLHAPPHRFLITSHGCSASNWLAYVLNQHHDIVCAHSSAAIIASDRAEVDVNEILRIEGLPGIYRKLEMIRSGYQNRSRQSLEKVFVSLETQLPARLYGLVHTFRLRDLPTQSQDFEMHFRPLPVANLIRHPIDLVQSLCGQFLETFRFDILDFQWTVKKIIDNAQDIVEELSAEHGFFPGDYDALCFLGACVCMTGLQQDIEATPFAQNSDNFDFLGTIRCEDITTDPEVLKFWVEQLSAKSVRADQDYLEACYRTGHVNRHNRDSTAKTSREKFETWRPWQKDAFTRIFARLAIRSHYEDQGYDFDMLD